MKRLCNNKPYNFTILLISSFRAIPFQFTGILYGTPCKNGVSKDLKYLSGFNNTNIILLILFLLMKRPFLSVKLAGDSPKSPHPPLAAYF